MTNDSLEAGQVRHNIAANRYEVEIGGEFAVAEYRLEKHRMILTHTYVPPQFRGHGIAEKLVRRALDDAQATKLSVLPACSYVAIFIERHPEYQPLLDKS